VLLSHTLPSAVPPALPGNTAKYAAVEELVALADEVGCTLPQLAVAFTAAHPAVTSTIIGPRTMDQLDALLAGAELTLDDAVLDRIDEIVPPGTNLYQPDGAWSPPTLTDPSHRRRPLPDRAAA
ncbi:aldo/keto reductase, partial [Micromonospora sp. NPDC005313]|uniref:aldo/keto reductase n=1 Tax=Micromonospora sp. NPDC005313 TaxID=3154296 RepID=UPI0033B871B9